MDPIKYYEIVKKFPKPTEFQICYFINILTREHSWYKHLSKERSHDFVIYIDPYGGKKLQGYSYNPFVVKDNDTKSFSSQDHIGYWNYYIVNAPSH